MVSNGFKIGERFLKIIFDNALRFTVDEIYVTSFNNTLEQNRLSELFTDWGFKKHGRKTSRNGDEDVFVRNFRPTIDSNPCFAYPFVNEKSNQFIVPIFPAYHTELFPD